MKKVLLSSLIILGSILVNAQYSVGIGAAIGNPSGLSVKVFTDQSKAFDFTFGWWVDYTALTGIYEIHIPLAQQLKFYLGPGAHIGSGKGAYQDSKLFIGADGALGAEWKPEAAIAVAMDFRPRIDIGAQTSFYPSAQIAVRYAFGNRSTGYNRKDYNR